MYLFAISVLLVFLTTQFSSASEDPQFCYDDQELESSLKAKPGQTLIVSFKGRSLEELEKEAKEKSTLSNEGDHLALIPELLFENSNSSQSQALEILEKRHQSRSSRKQYTQLWAFNMLIVHDADLDLLSQLRSLENIESIRLDKQVRMNPGYPGKSDFSGSVTSATTNINWGVKKIKAPEAWQRGIKGQGVIVGVISTGIRASHLNLKRNFIKENGWLDVVNGKKEPYDDDGLGTRVAGIAVGTRGIGVAPESKLIACKGIGKGGTFKESMPLECLQWMYCPSNSGTQVCPTRPKVVINAWSAYGYTDTYDGILKLYDKVGIIHVFNAGEHGPNCNTINSPAVNPSTIAVGGVDKRSVIVTTSGRGPTPKGLNKPDVVAPSVYVYSASVRNDTLLESFSGTVLAAAHVGGLAALLVSKNPTLGQRDVQHILTKSADSYRHSNPNPGDKRNIYCGGVATIPNNHGGYGLVNAQRALDIIVI